MAVLGDWAFLFLLFSKRGWQLWDSVCGGHGVSGQQEAGKLRSPAFCVGQGFSARHSMIICAIGQAVP